MSDPRVVAIGGQLDAVVESAVKALALELTANLTIATPVKTGWARANWIPSIGVPFAGPAAPSAEGGPQTQGTAAIVHYKLADGAAFVSNAVPYISRLNLGSSTQAPAGFVETAIDQAVQAVQQRFNVTFELGKGSFADLTGGVAAGNLASAFSPFGGEP